MTAQHAASINQLEGKCSGRRCFIVGTGSSLDAVDLKSLSREFMLSLNWAVIQTLGFRRSWWMWCDIRTYRQVWPQIKNRTASTELRAILSKKAHEIIRSYRGSARYISYGTNVEFKPRRTILETAVLIADFLGFEEIVLLGIDGFRPGGGNEPYCKELKSKDCYFMDRNDPDSWKKSARQFDKAMSSVMERVSSRVIQTSSLYDGDLFHNERLEDVLSRRPGGQKVDAPAYLGF